MSEPVPRSSTEAPRITIVTTPIRPVPTEYPPFGSLSVIGALNKAGYDRVAFYDIDGLRPTYDEVLEHLQAERPDILGISAVVSTAYDFTKRLTLDIKRLLPETTIILGGNLGASAEILLRKTGVDFVAVGEGERVIVDFVGAYRTAGQGSEFGKVAGLVYLDGDRLVNTGYVDPIAKEELYDVDWGILERYSKIENFFVPVTDSILAESNFAADPRAKEPHRRGKTIGTLVASKGCVARCTFCHRWDKGIRYIPVPIVMERLRYIVERYDVGFVIFGDENFGCDHTWLIEFCESIKSIDVLWSVHGMRVNRITPQLLRTMKEAGCCAVYFGMETGSRRMLEIMEKKVALEDNYNAITWIVEEGLHTTIQLVLGMPGETTETVEETCDFVGYAAQLSKNWNPLDLSINYAQALPGTPLYEFARAHRLIGQTVDDEEKYLLAISDRDASDESTTLNFTDYPRVITETWRPLVIAKAAVAYISKFGHRAYDARLAKSTYFSAYDDAPTSNESVSGVGDARGGHDGSAAQRSAVETGYFNFPREKVDLPKRNGEPAQKTIDVRGVTDSTQGVWQPVKLEGGRLPGLRKLLATRKWRVLFVRYPTLFYRLRFFLPLMVVAFDWHRDGFRYAGGLIKEYLDFLWQRLKAAGGRAQMHIESRSLRKIVADDIIAPAGDDPGMAPLRRGR